MSKIKDFRQLNHITQEQLADYLGIKASFISRMEGGSSKVPPAHLQTLLNNTQGWDTAPLQPGPADAQSDGAQGGAAVGCADLKAELEALRRENSWLRSLVEKFIDSKL